MEWRDADRDRLRRQLVKPGDVNINCADLPVFHRWDVTAKALIIALDNGLIARTVMEAFGCDAHPVHVAVGASDPVIQRIAALGDQEISNGGTGGRLYAEALATALIIHLFRSYGMKSNNFSLTKGGLPTTQLRRVLEYVDGHMEEDIGLGELAALTGLSVHHFGQAFKASVGMPPHQYLIDRRVQVAKEMLVKGNLPIAEIALATGFSSQSHFTLHFRKRAGKTPALYRREVSRRSLSNHP